MRNVLVTGGTGFIGTRLVEHLMKDPENVVTTFSRNIPDKGRKEHVVQVDLCDEQATSKAVEGVRPDWVFHLAGDKRVQNSEPLYREMVRSNIVATTNVLSALTPIKPSAFVGVGSFEEYGQIESPFREGASPRPLSPYGVTKLASTHLILAYARQYFPACVLRFPVVYGPGMSPTGSFLGGLINAAKTGKDFPMSGGEQARDFLHVSDLVDAFLLAARRIDECSGQVLNICSGQGMTLKDAAKAVESMVGRSFVKYGEVPYRTGEQMVCVGDPGLGRELLGWAPKVSFKEGISTFF